MQDAIAAYRRGAWSEAESLCRRVLHAKADHFDALYLLGIIAVQMRRTQEAAELLGRAAAASPANAAAQFSHGNALSDLGRFGEALAAYDRALRAKPDHAEACFNRGNVLKALGRPDEALGSYDRALTNKPDFAEACYNRGMLLDELARYDEAVASYDRALAIKPDFEAAHRNRGNLLKDLKRPAEALASYDRALRISPKSAEVLNNRGIVLRELDRLNEALDSYERALALRPEFAEAHYNRGFTLEKLERLDEALESYDHALGIKPDLGFAYGFRLHTRMRLCDWGDLESEIAELSARIERNEKATPPLPLLALTDSPALQRKAAEVWVMARHPASLALPSIANRVRHDRMRIGYFSADFRDHAVSNLMAGVFEMHDRSRFECTAFSLGPDTKDDVRKRVEAAFERFVDVRSRADVEVATLARNLEIDIAVDLGGFTQGSRTGIFAMRTAPLQASYLGYLGTMGAPYIDYLIADPTIVPPEHRRHFSEKIVCLPSYQANDSGRAIPDRVFTRAELGLPEQGFVFCCFNNNYKITPTVFDGWMRIVKRVEGSVLFLYADNRWAAANLRKEAAARGVDARRLVFGTRVPPAEYLARYRAADLFLDTLPYNAGTTASDALWAGLPVLTCIGQTFAGRVAASVLLAIGLPELVATSQAQYEALAVELANDPQRLREIRERLDRNRTTAPLFDSRLFTRHIEEAYVRMYERYQADLPPDHLDVN